MNDRRVANGLAFLAGLAVLIVTHNVTLAGAYSAFTLVSALCAPRIGDALGALMWEVATR